MSDERTEDGGVPAVGKSIHRRNRIVIPAAILIVAAAIAVSYWYVNLRGYVSTDDAYIDGDAVTVSSKILARVVTLGAGEGDAVASGQLLVQLDDTDLRAQEAQARA
ncbi:MAG: biotin/lipoyl-binding protein, partial [Candidatus Krumholzibacteria bacterium]|nr:biotin/lipoyl-binding protein [Candidatus Krumholzibacteria bacterium]